MAIDVHGNKGRFGETNPAQHSGQCVWSQKDLLLPCKSEKTV